MMPGEGNVVQRIDKWLWHARMFSTRSIATKSIAAGKVRVNAVRITKPSRTVVPGDVVGFVSEGRVRILKILALAGCRESFLIACTLYEDLSVATEKDLPRLLTRAVTRRGGAGRPTKLDRRRIGVFTTPRD